MTPDQFETLYRDHFRRIFNYIRFRVCAPHTAEDLTADVFVRAFEYGGSFCPEKGCPDAWLAGIARNVLYSHYKKTAAAPQMAELSDCLPHGADIEAEYLHKESLSCLLGHIDGLNLAHRELIALKYMLGLNNREIAALTGMSESAVGSALHRIIGGLRKKMCCGA